MTGARAGSVAGLRAEQQALANERIVAAAIALMEQGVEPTMRAVAQRAGFAERTLYRYHAKLEDLQDATFAPLAARIGAPLCTEVDALQHYATRLFRGFAANEALARVIATAPWARRVLTRSRRANHAAMRSLLARAFPTLPSAVIASAAASLRVPLSAAGWSYLMDCGIATPQAIRQVHWLIDTVLARLRAPEKGNA